MVWRYPVVTGSNRSVGEARAPKISHVRCCGRSHLVLVRVAPVVSKCGAAREHGEVGHPGSASEGSQEAFVERSTTHCLLGQAFASLGSNVELELVQQLHSCRRSQFVPVPAKALTHGARQFLGRGPGPRRMPAPLVVQVIELLIR